MTEILNIIFNVIAPIFLIIGAAYLIGKRFNPDAKSISVLLIYLFTPALVFRGFSTMKIDGSEIGGIAGVAVGVSLSMMALGILVTRYHRWQPELSGAFIVSVIMVNAANYGIPLNQFAFGDAGAERALIYYSVTVLIGNALGIFFASGGSVSPLHALKNVFSVPLTYAAIAGLLVNAGIMALPLPVTRAISDIAANGSIPGMLALLGLKLAQTSIKGRLRPIILATLLRLVIAPCIALPLALLFGLSGVSLKVAIIESSMPTAVLANALVTEFGGDGEFTSATTMVSTLVSILTLTVLLSLLM
jgi:hypothetical protein